MLSRQPLLPEFYHLPGYAGRVAFQPSLFSAAPFLNAAPQSGELLSGNSREGAAQNKAAAKSPGPYVIPGQSAMGGSSC